MRTAQGLGRGLGDPDVAGLSGGHGFSHRSDGLLDGDGRVCPVEVPEVDVVGAEMAEGPVDRAACVLRGAVETNRLAVVGEVGGELRSDERAIPIRAEHVPEELLVLERPVRLCSVEQGDPEVEGATDRRD